MKRYGSSNNLADDIGYSYFSGTNRLQTIGEGLSTYSYTYDANGNMLSDQLNRTGSIKYDHRNLMTEIRVIKSEAPSIFDPPVDVLYLTQYRYDEAGNRVRKVRYKYTGSTPDPVFDLSGDAPPWTLQSDEFYVRDISGKEIAIYSGSSLTQWNIWGLDNVGKINADTTRDCYLKDHLGSVRVVLNSTNTIISAQDYDAWGYILENRTYNASAMKYDFTGKERDNETSYDYFGARYYDSRIANWTSIDPLFEKHFDFSPYNYVLRSPIRFIDPDGKQIDVNFANGKPVETMKLVNELNMITGLNFYFRDKGSITLSYEFPQGRDFISGSPTARALIIRAYQEGRIFPVGLGNRKSLGDQTAGFKNNSIMINEETMEALETAFADGNFVNLEWLVAYSWGMSIIHEMLHKMYDWSEERIIEEENKIRGELGFNLGKRIGHDEFHDWYGDGYIYIPMSLGAFSAFTTGRMPSASDQFVRYQYKQK